MKEKYYTPKIEEFHVGFEYEEKWWNGKEDIWSKAVIFDWYTGLENEIRVKYLDQADIEELGWKLIEEITIIGLGAKSLVFEKEGISLTFVIDICVVNIDGQHRIPGRLFYGIIKNKSELKILMKQLEI